MSLTINPFAVPQEQQGWRGLTYLGRPRRKVFTVLENEHVLVTALLQIPGEPAVRHSHESGELSIQYHGDMRPLVTWHGPGELHGGGAAPAARTIFEDVADNMAALQDTVADSHPDISKLFGLMGQLQDEIHQLRDNIMAQQAHEPAPNVLIDILFPPFKTTVEDDAYPEKITFTGQWLD
jgi:hypothetical protein